MERERSAAAAMLGFPGFVVRAVSDDDGELEQAIETTADLVGCPGCGAVAELHDRRPSWVRDLPTAGRAVTLVGLKRVWRCRHQLCETMTWTETSPAIAPRASLTERARAEVCRWVGEDGASATTAPLPTARTPSPAHGTRLAPGGTAPPSMTSTPPGPGRADGSAGADPATPPNRSNDTETRDEPHRTR